MSFIFGDPSATIYIGDSRNMGELSDETVDLIVTSPPYWHIKDYGIEGQIGYGQTLHEYLIDISRVWGECWRVLKPGRRLCINIGDQFARSILLGRYKVIPLHSEIIAQCETIGFDYMGAIIWRKKTTMRPTGGAVVMGSFPYPPNGIVELDYEYILLFKKPGTRTVQEKRENLPNGLREASKLTRDEWKAFFSGHWEFGGERQIFHEAMFPEELPRRLIRMFSFIGETVLDPFLGSGTTVKVALELKRNAIGYEIQPEFEPVIREKLGLSENPLIAPPVRIVHRKKPLAPSPSPPGYVPAIKDCKPLVNPRGIPFGNEATYKVVKISDETTLQMENGMQVQLLGVTIRPERREETLAYLRQFLLGKRVFLRFQNPPGDSKCPFPAYVYLTNRLFVNRKMIEMGLADADLSIPHPYTQKFLKAQTKRQTGEEG
ncbi:MAG: DNA methyltransferase [Armatimonadetes bacterium]|nr:DNA methyltransferase [Armatimonadota bacterium]MDW8121735.1 DNA methyltransferase [Armatimonadota bacterium]